MDRKRRETARLEDQSPEEPSGGGADGEAGWTDRIRAPLVAWYGQAHRDLPWRISPDPYRILVSELMLVQTTVAAVVPYYTRFLARFPDVGALATADEAEVLKAWEGLGYYRRARQLHAAARVIVSEYGGKFPDDPDALRALPGVGRYIAGAILSIAFDHPAPILEANTQRVLARLLACRENVRSTATQKRLWDAAARLVPPTGAGAFNQALMELGALVCVPREPHCLICPVAAECRARALGIQDEVPVLAARPAPLSVVEACAVVARDGRWLIVQRSPGGLWDGFWELPTIHLQGADPAGRGFGALVDLEEGVRRLTAARVRLGSLLTTIRYSVTRHRVELNAYSGVGLSEALVPGPGLVQAVWARPEALGDYLFASPYRRLIKGLTGPGGRHRTGPSDH
jgi:A/G-specific adenine glycosylase